MVKAGFLVAELPGDSDICLVNTCGFIHDARDESCHTLRELLRMRKRSGHPRFLVALGCLVERAEQIPEFADLVSAADVRIGFKDFNNIPAICYALWDNSAIPQACVSDSIRTSELALFHSSPRLRFGPPHSAYLKISEGCSHGCRFCTIPSIRGRPISQPIPKLVEETCQLIESGAREINIIAQDTTSYGRDIYGKPQLAKLLLALLSIKDFFWMRLLYAHPAHLNEDIIEALASDPRCCPYIDLPLQHIADPVLDAMGRRTRKREILQILDMIGKKLPNSAMRTTFIVGYPGETEEHFGELLAFVNEGRFAHAGVFTYSPEPETSAAALPDIIPMADKNIRRDIIMKAQREVSRQNLKKLIGGEVNVIVDGPVARKLSKDLAKTTHTSRTQQLAPDVDGVVYIQASQPKRELHPGDVIPVRITNSLDYDLVGVC